VTRHVVADSLLLLLGVAVMGALGYESEPAMARWVGAYAVFLATHRGTAVDLAVLTTPVVAGIVLLFVVVGLRRRVRSARRPRQEVAR
jgi:hypothetical protein